MIRKHTFALLASAALAPAAGCGPDIVTSASTGTSGTGAMPGTGGTAASASGGGGRIERHQRIDGATARRAPGGAGSTSSGTGGDSGVPLGAVRGLERVRARTAQWRLLPHRVQRDLQRVRQRAKGGETRIGGNAAAAERLDAPVHRPWRGLVRPDGSATATVRPALCVGHHVAPRRCSAGDGDRPRGRALARAPSAPQTTRPPGITGAL